MRLHADSVIGLLLILFCGVMYAATTVMPPAPYGTMGPALFPRLILYILAPLSVALAVRGLIQDWRERGAPSAPSGRRPLGEWFYDYRNVLVSYALFFAFLLLLDPLGYLLAGFLFVFFMQLYMGPRTWRMVPIYAVGAAGFTLVLYVVFRWFLIVILPEGDLFL